MRKLILSVVVFCSLSKSRPIPHQYYVDGHLLCPDGRSPEKALVVVSGPGEYEPMFRDIFSPADEYCFGFKPVVGDSPRLMTQLLCLVQNQKCVFANQQTMPAKFLDRSEPFRPEYRARKRDMIGCGEEFIQSIFNQTTP